MAARLRVPQASMFQPTFLESEREQLGSLQIVAKTKLIFTSLSCAPGLVLLQLDETNAKLRGKLVWGIPSAVRCPNLSSF